MDQFRFYFLFKAILLLWLWIILCIFSFFFYFGWIGLEIEFKKKKEEDKWKILIRTHYLWIFILWIIFFDHFFFFQFLIQKQNKLFISSEKLGILDSRISIYIKKKLFVGLWNGVLFAIVIILNPEETPAFFPTGHKLLP